MVKFLSGTHFNLLRDMIPQIIPYSQRRFCSYLSFYLSHSSKHLYHSADIYSIQTLQKYFSPQFEIELTKTVENVNKEHLLARQLLGINFQEHLLDQQAVLRWYSDLGRLQLLGKRDIIQEFLKSKCRVDGSHVKVATEINPIHRRTFYVAFNGSLPDPTLLEQKLTMNPFYQLRNTNKLLFFAETPETSLQLPSSLEKFCKQFDIKIKLLKDSTTKGILQYLYVKSKKNLLIHEVPNAHNSIFEVKKVQSGKKGKSTETPRPAFSSNFHPQAIMVLSQRLPKQTLVKDNRDLILQKMKKILEIPSNQNLINEKTLNFAQLQKNYIYEPGEAYKGGQNEIFEGKYGFSVRQFVTEKVYKQNRLPQINRGNPFSEKQAKHN